MLPTATFGGAILNTFLTITPMKAVELVEAAGIEDARRIIADFAAAGLVKSYALKIETIDARGARHCARGPTIPEEVWQRVVLGDLADDVWSSGTVRLAGSELLGGDPATIVTGVTFNPKHIAWLIAHHQGAPTARRRKRKAKVAPNAAAAEAVDKAEVDVPDAPPSRRKADPAAIPPGALLASMEQAESALGVSRGTIYNLLKRGKLIRAETGLRSVSIEVASIKAFAEPAR